MRSVYIHLSPCLQSVNEFDDLYPAQGSEDWHTHVQHPQALHLRDKVQLVLSDSTVSEYEIPDHTAEELLHLSQSYSRMEMHSLDDIRSHDNSNNVRTLTEHIDRFASLYGCKL